MQIKPQKAFTLIEMIVTLAIIAVLVTIAYPLYQSHLVSVRRADAQLTLLKVSSALENYYLKHHTYLGASLTILNFPELTPQGFYRIHITLEQDSQSYQIQAIPTKEQAKADAACGTLILTTDGRRTYLGNDPQAICW